MSEVTNHDLQQHTSEIKSAINAKHSLLGIAFLLLIQQACITDDIRKSERRIKEIPVCQQQKTN